MIEIINSLVNQLILPGTHPAMFWTYMLIGMLILGIDKSGFGGGVGIFTFPLLCLVMRVDRVAAIMLPMLCLFDLNAIYHFRQEKDLKKLAKIIPSILIGVAIGSIFWFWVGSNGIERFDRPLKIFVGITGILFALYIFFKDTILRHVTSNEPNFVWTHLTGISAGITSTIAHAAGPIISLYMYVQRMNKTQYVGTVAWTFTFINFSKLPTYTFAGLFDATNLAMALVLLPVVPIGSYLGKWLHDRISEELFNRVIMICVFIAGLQLISGKNFILWVIGR
jgi:uncharacterized protein